MHGVDVTRSSGRGSSKKEITTTNRSGLAACVDFDVGAVFALDFGETVDIETLRTEIVRVESAAFVIPSGDNGFFIGGKDVAQDDQETLLTALEDVFGLADRISFDFDDGAALTLRFTRSGATS